MSIGHIHFQQKNYEQAAVYYANCAALKDFFDNYVNAEFHNKLGQLYDAKGQINAAIDAFETSLAVTNAFGFKEIAKENHEALAQIYNQNKQFDKAYQESIAVNELNKVMFQETTQKSMTEAQFKFDVEKRDLQIEGQNKDLKQSKIIRWLLIGGLILTLILLSVTWLQMRKKQEAKKRIELVIKELHHRVKNNLQTIASMMRLQARQVKDPSVSAVLLENKLRLETFSMLHQQLYQTDDLQKVDLQPFIRGIIEKLLFSYSIPYDKVNTQITVENKMLDVETAIPLGLILNELLTNSFKYAYPSVETLDIMIDIKNKSLHYTDNGNSLPDDFDFNKKAGFGINLIQSFAQQLKGKYQFSKQNGINFQLKFN
jgi:two-component sensor histidine kinase